MGITKEQWGDNNRSAIVYVAQWENLERWYDIGTRRKRVEIVGTIDKGLGPGVWKYGLECRHVMRVISLVIDSRILKCGVRTSTSVSCVEHVHGRLCRI